MPVQHTTQATGTNDGTKQVSVNVWNEAHTISEYIDIPVPTSTPAAPAAGSRLYTALHAGKALLTTRDANNVEVMFQPHIGEMALFQRLIVGTGTSTTTLVTNVGYAGFTINGTVNSTTLSLTTPSTGSVLNNVRRYSNVTGTTSATHLTIRSNALFASQVTGFMFMTTVHLASTSALMRGFFGLLDTTNTQTTAIDYTTATTNNKIGFGFAANTGNWQFIRGAAGASPALIDLGASFPINTTDLLRFSLFCERDTTTVFYLVENLTSGATASGSVTTTLPAAATLMGPYQYMTNNTNAASVGWTSTGWHLEQYI